MHRMGHSTMRAALIYQHATEARSRDLGERLDALVKSQRAIADEGRDMGPQLHLVARAPFGAPDDDDAGGEKRGPDLQLWVWSGRRESNSHVQLGKTARASTRARIKRNAMTETDRQ